MQARAGLDDHARGFHAGAMARDARKMAPLRPAAVAIHDDGEMLRKRAGIQFFEKLRFLAVAGFRSSAGFHRKWLEGPARQIDAAEYPVEIAP